MDEQYTNISKACRKDADMTQEEWAEALYVSVDTVKAWETNLRVPSNANVARMVERCGNTFWAYKHLTQTADALGVLEPMNQTGLQTAAIRVVNCVLDFADRNRDRQLLRIAEDGVISEDERPTYDAIVAEIREILAAGYALRYCVEGQKKSSPDAANIETAPSLQGRDTLEAPSSYHTQNQNARG